MTDSESTEVSHGRSSKFTVPAFRLVSTRTRTPSEIDRDDDYNQLCNELINSIDAIECDESIDISNHSKVKNSEEMSSTLHLRQELSTEHATKESHLDNRSNRGRRCSHQFFLVPVRIESHQGDRKRKYDKKVQQRLPFRKSTNVPKRVVGCNALSWILMLLSVFLVVAIYIQLNSSRFGIVKDHEVLEKHLKREFLRNSHHRPKKSRSTVTFDDQISKNSPQKITDKSHNIKSLWRDYDRYSSMTQRLNNEDEIAVNDFKAIDQDISKVPKVWHSSYQSISFDDELFDEDSSEDSSSIISHILGDSRTENLKESLSDDDESVLHSFYDTSFSSKLLNMFISVPDLNMISKYIGFDTDSVNDSVDDDDAYDKNRYKFIYHEDDDGFDSELIDLEDDIKSYQNIDPITEALLISDINHAYQHNDEDDDLYPEK